MASEERIVNHWKLAETLGKGAYGLVKKGIHITNGKPYALKFMNKDSAWPESEREKVATEIQSLQLVRHPNVMKLFAYDLSCQYPMEEKEGGGTIETVLLVLELCPGGELFDILYYTSKLPEIIARTYFRQLISGLEAIHAEGITHRDLKPQNLLLDGRYNLKIIDFGLANIFEGDAGAEINLLQTTAVGTKGYQSPEIVLGREYTNLCDIFACGVILFVMLTGYPPFETANARTDKWYKKIAAKKYSKFWSRHNGCGIEDEALKDLICGMLTYQPNERLTLAQVKESAWYNGETLDSTDLALAMKDRHRASVEAKKKDLRGIELDNATLATMRDLEFDDSIPIPIDAEAHISQFGTFEFDSENFSAAELFTFVNNRILEFQGESEVDNETYTLVGKIQYAGGDSTTLTLRTLQREENGPVLVSLEKESTGFGEADKQIMTAIFEDINHMLGDPYMEDLEYIEYDDEDFNLM